MSKYLSAIVIFLILIISGCLQIMFYLDQKNDELEVSAQEAVDANKSLEQSIIDMQQQISIAESVNKKSEENRKYLNRQLINSKQKITELGEQNETIESYLDTPIPDEIFDLLREDSGDQEHRSSEGKTTVKPVIAH